METNDIEKKVKKIDRSAWAFFIRKKSIAWLLIIGVSIFGLITYNTLPREIQPEINIAIGAVSSFLPGANTADTESLLTIPLEKQIGTISGIKQMTSSSGFGSSVIVIQFDTGVNIDKGMQDLKDAVDRAKGDLPADAIDPMVIRANTNDYAIISFAVTGDRPTSQLTKIAKDIQPALEKVSGVSKVNVVGALDQVVYVTLDQNKLEDYGLDIQTVSGLIKYANTNVPLGVMSFDKLNYSIRIDNRYQTLEEVRNIPLFTTRGQNPTPILLKDVAKVEQTYPDQNVITKISVAGKKSLPAVSLQMYKKEGGNILAIADNAKAKIDELKNSGVVPKDVDVVVSNDNSDFIRSDLGILTRSGIETTILIIIILFLALGFRQGLIAGLSVPLGFFITFIFMDYYGLSINSLSLFSLVIALGIAVDVSIVIMQGIHANIKNGMNTYQAALLAVDTYKWPLIAGTFTTIFAFSPMLLVSGIIGEFLKTLPIVISISLLASLFLGLTITPALSTGFLNSEKIKNKNLPLERLLNALGAGFHKFIEAVVEKRSIRVFTFSILIILFMASMALPLSGALKTELFPVTNQNYFTVNIELPSGTILEKTQKVTEQVEEIIYKNPDVKNFLTTIGSDQSPALSSGSLLSGGGSNENSNIANITVNLTDKESRQAKSYDIAENLENELKNINTAKITITQLQEGPPSGASITMKITGEDLDTLKKVAGDIQTMAKKIPGTKNVETSLKQGLNEFKFVLDKDALAYHDLSAIQVAGNIRSILQGINTTTIKVNGDDTDIIVRYNLPKINNRTNISLHDIENFQIFSPKGYSVSLAQLGTYSFGESPEAIAREDQKRKIEITGNVEENYNSVDITKALQDQITKMNLPSGYDVSFGGDLEEITKSFTDLFKTMIVGLILIAFVLVLEFNSFKQAFLLLLSLPMGLIGVFPGLYILGLNLSFPAFLGIVALAGVVVNHAIVLIARINENRKNDMRFPVSIAEACNSRFQPIFITTLAAVFGILPLALTNEFWAGLGFSLIFGLAFSTLLTLVAIPIVYYTFEVKNAGKNGEF